MCIMTIVNINYDWRLFNYYNPALCLQATVTQRLTSWGTKSYNSVIKTKQYKWFMLFANTGNWAPNAYCCDILSFLYRTVLTIFTEQTYDGYFMLLVYFVFIMLNNTVQWLDC